MSNELLLAMVPSAGVRGPDAAAPGQRKSGRPSPRNGRPVPSAQEADRGLPHPTLHRAPYQIARLGAAESEPCSSRRSRGWTPMPCDARGPLATCSDRWVRSPKESSYLLAAASAIAAAVMFANASPLLPGLHADGVQYVEEATSLASGGLPTVP